MEEMQNRCRSCNKEKQNLLNLFSIEDDEPTLAEKFVCCTTISVKSNDYFPQNICYSCTKQLESAYLFYVRCAQSNEAFINFLPSVGNEFISIHTDGNSGKDLQNEEVTISSEPDSIFPISNDNKETQDQHLSDYNFENIDYTSNETDHSDEEQCIKWEQCKPLSPAVLEKQFNAESLHSESDFDITLGPFSAIEPKLDEKEHYCAICNKNFFTEKAHTFHTKINHKSRRLTLEKQNKINLNHNDFDIFSDIKPSVKSILCQICGKQIRSEVFDEHHNLHSKREISCPTCAKTFPNKKSLQCHEMYHSNKFYKCKINDCGSTYRHKYKFTNHLFNVHGLSEKKRLKQIESCAQLDK